MILHKYIQSEVAKTQMYIYIQLECVSPNQSNQFYISFSQPHYHSMKSFNSVNIWSLSPKRYAHTGIPTIATLESISNANDLNQPSLHWKLHMIYIIYIQQPLLHWMLSPMLYAHNLHHSLLHWNLISNALRT